MCPRQWPVRRGGGRLFTPRPCRALPCRQHGLSSHHRCRFRWSRTGLPVWFGPLMCRQHRTRLSWCSAVRRVQWLPWSYRRSCCGSGWPLSMTLGVWRIGRLIHGLRGCWRSPQCMRRLRCCIDGHAHRFHVQDSMKILFVHQGFPAQFKYLAPALARDPAHQVLALVLQDKAASRWQGVQLVPYRPARGSTPGIHPWMVDLETKTIRAEAAMLAALQLRAQGGMPDVIVGHPGWGESLFLKDVWPQARLGIYCEFFYHAQGADVGFDPEFASGSPGEVARLRLMNVNNLLHFGVADAGIAPTRWQASTFPEAFRSRITVVHDGIDTQAIAPNPMVRVRLGNGLELTRHDEVITFVNRNLDPYRGYHIF